MPAERAQSCVDALRSWGYSVKTGVTLGGNSDNYFSGTDDERLADLQHALDDPDVQAILCGRGGYGLTRIIDRVDFTSFAKSPKWIVGYSDITLLHSHIQSQYHIATLHAPMAAAFNDGGGEGSDVLSIRRALEGKPLIYSCAVHSLNRPGEVIGELTGGNLALVAHTTGTSSAVSTAGKILFLEDVGEYLYNIDRMIRQLKRGGRLERLAGLIVGSFTEGKDTMRPFGANAEEIIREAIDEYDYPVCFGFPVGHGGRNVALLTGMPHRLSISAEGVVLQSY